MKNGALCAVFHFYDGNSAASPRNFATGRKFVLFLRIAGTMRSVCYFR